MNSNKNIKVDHLFQHVQHLGLEYWVYSLHRHSLKIN